MSIFIFVICMIITLIITKKFFVGFWYSFILAIFFSYIIFVLCFSFLPLEYKTTDYPLSEISENVYVYYDDFKYKCYTEDDVLNINKQNTEIIYSDTQSAVLQKKELYFTNKILKFIYNNNKLAEEYVLIVPFGSIVESP